ncbi:MAG TPA: hypothetical protein VEL79_06635 [Vicinamibacterales bacterium]|nr:hypothetical protein [Vicinamibacterales bacterium]
MSSKVANAAAMAVDLLSPMLVRRLICLGFLLAIALGATPARAQGGPPLITDDPDTPGPGYWEINLSTFLEKHSHSHTLELPRVDANYGVGRRVQLKLEMPWVRGGEDGEVRTGAGNMTAGVKYRFLGQEGTLIAWSVYPQIEFNTTHASVTKGLVEDGRQLFLPTELTIEKLHAEINAEVGRRFVQNGEDAWEYGVSTEGHVIPRLELLAELHGESRAGTRDELIVNVGARPKLTKQIILLFAVGRAIHGPDEEHPHVLLYAGLQFNVPGLYSFKSSKGSRGF